MSSTRSTRAINDAHVRSQVARSTLLQRASVFALFAVSLAVYIEALRVTYSEFMAPRFGYLGWIYREPDPQWMLISYALLLGVSAFLPYTARKFSQYAVWFLYASLLVPVTTLPLYGGGRPPEDTFMFALFCSAVWIGVALILRRDAALLVPVKASGSGLFWTVVGSISVITYVYLAAIFGLTFNIVSVFEIYDIRLSYRDEVIPTVPLLGYLITNQGNVINPFLMAFGLLKRKYWLFALGIVGQLLIYSTTGYKTVLISIPLCLLLVFLLKKRTSVLGAMVVFGAAALAWLAIAIDRIVPLGVVDVLVARTFMTAGYLMPFYREVYDGGAWALWDYSFLSPFVTAPYDTSPGFHVGAVMIGRPDVQMNASLFADGYANLGFAGIIIEAAVLVVLLFLVDSASRGLPPALVVSAGLLPVFSLANGSPFSAILSYGFGLLIVLLALYPRENAETPLANPKTWAERRVKHGAIKRRPVRSSS
ncbi:MULTISPECIES: hypothetical protein [unclassified Microbacterium]|uniref:hypothetical protein n=1 Tax=unclassified Microbacterium TaxID=2609290 RepID=UPI000EAA930D|nr:MULTISPECIES: hypothetical protein [unclassified Microbacterium]MBT2485827.1 hypothetical protein [Microbacterium sp. ISL-108]RKN68589.1 hypothetical protein D7252_14010 [Microbacterium sp. CGR2]